MSASSTRSERTRRRPKSDLTSPELIKLVSRYRILWDPAFKDYSDSLKKEAVWNYIASNFWNLTGEEARYHWEKLRTAQRNFHRRLKKRNTSGRATDKKTSKRKCATKYIYDDEMSFLPSVKGEDKTDGNLSDDSSNSSIMSAMEYSIQKSVMLSPHQPHNSQVQKALSFSTMSPLSSSLTGNKMLDEEESGSKLKSSPVLSPSSINELSSCSPINRKKRVRKFKLETILEEEESGSKRKPNPSQSSVYSQSTCCGSHEKLGRFTSKENSPPKEKSKKKNSIPTPPKHKPSRKRILSPIQMSNFNNKKMKDSDMLQQSFLCENDSPLSQAPKRNLPRKVLLKIEMAKQKEAKREALRNHLLKQEKEAAAAKAQRVNPKAESKTDNKDVSEVALEILRQIQNREDEPDSVSLFMNAMALRIAALPAKLSRRLMLNLNELVVDAEERAETPDSKNTTIDKLQIMVDEFGLKISNHDLDTLLPSQMLNDQIMNYYVRLLAESSKNVYIFNTFFMVQLLSKNYLYEDIKQWTKNVDIFSFPLLLIPIYKSTHWTMAVVNNDLKQLMFYNSLGSNLYEDCFEALKKYLKEEHQERKGVELDFKQWSDMGDFIDGPMQENGYDCGVFVLEVARRLCLEQSLEFTQEDIPRIRRRIRTEILNCLLMD